MRKKSLESGLVLLVCLSMGLGVPDACIAKNGNCKKITVVKGHTSTILQTSVPQTPVPQYTQVGGKVFCIGRCIVTSSTKVSDTEYDTAVDLDELGTKVLGVCFAECANTKHVVIRTDALYDKGAMLNIIVNKDESTYSVINDDTVAIMGYTLSR